MYFSFWFLIAHLSILTRNEPLIGIWQNFKEARTLAFPYYVFTFFTGLFTTGLAVWFVIPALVWSVWSTFSTFVFLYEVRGRLKPLWRSKQLVKGDFWPVLGRILLYQLPTFALTAFLGMSRYTGAVAALLNSFVIQPLFICYLFEMYKALAVKKPATEPVKGGAWIGISLLGWVILIVLIAVVFLFLVRVFQSFTPNDLGFFRLIFFPGIYKVPFPTPPAY